MQICTCNLDSVSVFSFLYREAKSIQTPSNKEHKVVAKDTNFDGSDTSRGDYENVQLPTSNPYAGSMRASTAYEEVQYST